MNRLASQTCVLLTTCFVLYIAGAATKNDVQLQAEYREGRIENHPDKTKIPSNQSSNRRKEMEINNIKFEMLSACDSAKYLGQTVKFQHQETAEIRNRIRAAWASFHRYKQELTSKSYFLLHRLRLFNMVITPTLSYASGFWTLSREHERMIGSTQSKMLRLIVQTERNNKKKTQTSKNEKDEEDKNANHRGSDEAPET